MRFILRPVMLAALVVGCASPPDGGAVQILPDAPRTADDLVAEITEDAVPHNDKKTVTYTWSWYVDDQLVTDLSGATVPAARTAKGETWRVVAIASDGKREGEAFSGQTTILNTAPVAQVGIAPAAPATTDPLVATATASDADGDEVTYAWSWTRDGQAVAGLDGPSVAADRTARGERWVVTAVPNDGDADGDPVTAEVVIRNTAPTANAVALAPAEAYTTTTLTATVDATDIDGDAIDLAYRWLVDDAAVAGNDAPTLSGAFFVRGQSVVVEVTPSDDADAGAPLRSEPVVILNSPPVAASAAISPTVADVTTTVTCAAGALTDADGDAVTVAYAWLIDGSVVGSGPSLALAAYRKGQRVACRVTPNDGLTDGAPVLSADLTIGNAAPGAAELEIDPAEPFPHDDLFCDVVRDAADPDGDRLTYTFSWTRDGADWTGATATTVHAGDTIPSSATRVGEEWSCAAVASDGAATGPEAVSAPVTIQPADYYFARDTYWVLPADGTSTGSHSAVCAEFGLRATASTYTVPGGWSRELYEEITVGLGYGTMSTGCCVAAMWCYTATKQCWTHNTSSATFYNWGWGGSLGQGVFSCIK
jgi:hypothetical protein